MCALKPMKRITKKNKMSKEVRNIKIPATRTYQEKKVVSEPTMHSSSSNNSSYTENGTSEYDSQEELIDLEEEEEIEQRQLKQMKRCQPHMQRRIKKEELDEIDEINTHEEEEEAGDEKEDFLSEMETEESLDDFVDEEPMNDEEEWLKAVEKDDDTQATKLIPLKETILHVGKASSLMIVPLIGFRLQRVKLTF
jgi:hypothetical protein